MTVGSLAYRNNEREILRGKVPQKYLRLLPYIPGDKILEIGSAEGVLSLCLARQDMGAKKEATALEQSAERHEAALALHANWARAYRFSCHPVFVNGTVGHHPELLAEGNFDTLVAVRMIYYLGDTLDPIFSLASRHIPNVVLCGNGNRARDWRSGLSCEETKANNYYASREGMRDVLTRHGYRIVQEVAEGDEIVIGRIDG